MTVVLLLILLTTDCNINNHKILKRSQNFNLYTIYMYILKFACVVLNEELINLNVVFKKFQLI